MNQLPLPTVGFHRYLRVTCSICFSFVLAATATADHGNSLGVPGVRGGVVTTSESVAARVGADVLRRGGNAVDAAAAVVFALNVVEPQSSGIGGGGFMMIHLAKTRDTVVVDSRERAPAAADPEMFLDANGEPFAFAIRSTSGIAVGVPGMVRGVAHALEKWGSMEFAQLLQPAFDLAANGFRVSERLAESVLSARLDSEPGNPAYDLARRIFRPGGEPLQENDLLVQPDLAKTLRMLIDQGADAFYTGPIARAIVDTQLLGRTVADPKDQERLSGRMFLQDLAQYEVAVRKPVEGTYRGFRIISMPPPSSGGLTVIQILKLIERFPIGDRDAGFGFGSTRTLNTMIEAMRLAFADRAVWMGDDDFVLVPKRGLLNDDYIALRSELIDPDSRQVNVLADDPRPFDGAATRKANKVAQLQAVDEEGLNTTHFTIVDAAGNIVSYTNTIESAWGTGLMVPGFGFLLNNELTDFNSAPTFNPDPNNFNPGANDAAPLKRPRSSMAPTLVFRNRQPRAAFGSPGGSTIINSVVNVAINLIDHERPVGEAVDAPRISQTSANGSPTFEAGFDLEVIRELAALGHIVDDQRLQVIGSVQAIVVDRRGGRQYGAADRRRIGGIQSLPRRTIRQSFLDNEDEEDIDRRQRTPERSGIAPQLTPLGITARAQ